MNIDIEAIRARADAATPGPWKVIEKGNSVASYAVVTVPIDGKKQLTICPNMSTKTSNADFIAHAREDIPALIAEVERLRAERDKLREATTDAYLQLETATFSTNKGAADLAKFILTYLPEPSSERRI